MFVKWNKMTELNRTHQVRYFKISDLFSKRNNLLLKTSEKGFKIILSKQKTTKLNKIAMLQARKKTLYRIYSKIDILKDINY